MAEVFAIRSQEADGGDADSVDFKPEPTAYSSHSARKRFGEPSAQTQTERGVDDHPEDRSLLSGQVSNLFLLLCVVLCYIGPPIIVNSAKTVGRNPNGSPIKVNTFLEIVVVFLALLFISLLCMLLALYYDWKHQHEKSHFWLIWSMNDLLAWAPVSVGHAVADTAEAMANGRIDAATYAVFSQLKLVGTGLALWAFLPPAPSSIQWMVLIALTLTIVSWELTPDHFSDFKPEVGHTRGMGFVFTGVKVCLSILLGVSSQKLLHRENVPLYIQQARCSFISCLCMAAFLPLKIYVLLPAIGEPWWDKDGKFYGFFAGEPSTPGGPPTAWSHKVFYVILLYAFREVSITYCLKRFDAMVTTLCGAVATVSTYWLSVIVLEDVAFNHVKAMGTATIGLLVVMYKAAEETSPSKSK